MAMDDLSDDGVSPPEWQSGSEREPEDDKEIEGNEPDEIPPSDPDSYVGLKEAENNGQWLQGIGKSVDRKSTRLNSSHSRKTRMPSSA